MLTSIKNHEILVELKNGETICGKLTDCDSWMNLTLSEVVVTYNEGEKFSKVPEIYIRGMHIKTLRLPETVCIIAQTLHKVLTPGNGPCQGTKHVEHGTKESQPETPGCISTQRRRT